MFSFFRRKKQSGPVSPPPTVPRAALPPVPASARNAHPAPEPRPPTTGTRMPDGAALLGRSSEDLCGIERGMDRREIHALLARLFRRHNRAASSLDDQLRAEAEIMLQAIVDIRHRYLEAEDEEPPGGGVAGSG